jgi:choline dehydrogenase-like flavoprotein
VSSGKRSIICALLFVPLLGAGLEAHSGYQPYSKAVNESFSPLEMQEYERTHVALFSLFFPLERDLGFLLLRAKLWREYSQDERIVALISKVSRPHKLGRRGLLASFGRLFGFGSHITFFDSVRMRSRFPRGQLFHRMDLESRQLLFRFMFSSRSSSLRRLAMQLRWLYTDTIYGSDKGRALAGRKPLSKEAPDMESFLAKNQLKLGAKLSVADGRLAMGETTTFDEVVIGSGPAGSVLAHQLSRAGHNVLLLDMGSLVVPGARRTVDEDGLKLGDGFVFTENGEIRVDSAMVGGGGSTVNHDLVVPPVTDVVMDRISRWRAEKTFPDIDAKSLGNASRWTEKRLGTRGSLPEELDRNNQILWDGAQSLSHHPDVGGVPLAPRLYRSNSATTGEGLSSATEKHRAVSAFLVPAVSGKHCREANAAKLCRPVAILPDAEVLRIEFAEQAEEDIQANEAVIRLTEPWDVPGTLVDPNQLGAPVGTEVRVSAKRFILAAGSVGSPAILLRSLEAGRRLPSELKQAGNNVGRGALLHPTTVVLGVFDDSVDALDTSTKVYVPVFEKDVVLDTYVPSTGDIGFMGMGTAEESHDLVKQAQQIGGIAVTMVDSVRSENRVRLDGNGQPIIEYSMGREDREHFRWGVSAAVQILFEQGAARVLVPTTEELLVGQEAGIESAWLERGDALAADGIRFLPNRTSIHSMDLQGTNKMGSEPKSSVVSTEHRLWGTTNVYLMDSSIFPESVGAHPMQTIYSLSRIFSRRLLSGEIQDGVYKPKE